MKQENHLIGTSLLIRGKDQLFLALQESDESGLMDLDGLAGTLELDFFASLSMQVSNHGRNLSVQLTQDQAFNSLYLDDDCELECNDC